MPFEIGDSLERFAEWILAIPRQVPILLGADPHNASLVRAMAALLLLALVLYVVASFPLRSILARFKNISGGRDKPS
jgi:hypothetical protein